jgi:uncharacterized spore protein YtfJ
MENDKSFEILAEHLEHDASVKNVFGEPITAQGKTIIPVARVAMGMGSGFGRKSSHDGEEKLTKADREKMEGTGGGTGGGLIATPKGVYEVTPGKTRFVSADAKRYLLIGGVIGAFIGGWLFSRRRRKNKD